MLRKNIRLPLNAGNLTNSETISFSRSTLLYVISSLHTLLYQHLTLEGSFMFNVLSSRRSDFCLRNLLSWSTVTPQNNPLQTP